MKGNMSTTYDSYEIATSQSATWHSGCRDNRSNGSGRDPSLTPAGRQGTSSGTPAAASPEPLVGYPSLALLHSCSRCSPTPLVSSVLVCKTMFTCTYKLISMGVIFFNVKIVQSKEKKAQKLKHLTLG